MTPGFSHRQSSTKIRTEKWDDHGVQPKEVTDNQAKFSILLVLELCLQLNSMSFKGTDKVISFELATVMSGSSIMYDPILTSRLKTT